MEEDDFNFPTAAAPPEEDDDADLPSPAGRLLPAASTPPPLWPFSSSPRNPSTAPAGSRAGEEWEREGADAASAEERMDLLWEDFNAEELLLCERARSSAAHRRAGSANGGRSPSISSSSDAESEKTEASASGRRYGCAPMMLRASSRAGGPGQLYGGSRRRRSGGWALLLRLFRRLFVVDKTPPYGSRSRPHGIYVP